MRVEHPLTRTCYALEIEMPKKHPASSSTQDNKPVRKLVECSPHRLTGGGGLNGPSEIHVEHESYPERNALEALSLCHDVRKISSQASKEPYELNGLTRHHIPDFIVDCAVDGLRLEVKALTSLVGDESLEKYRQVARGYIKHRVPFAFLTDAQLEAQPRFRSVKLLARYVSSKIPQEINRKALGALRQQPLSVKDLQRQASIALVDVWTLIAQRLICFDWDAPLHLETTLVSLPDQPFRGLQLEDILTSTRFYPLLAELAMGRRPTDKQLMADAATWRQQNHLAGPFSCVGGFQHKSSLHSLTQEESSDRAHGGRSHHPVRIATGSADCT